MRMGTLQQAVMSASCSLSHPPTTDVRAVSGRTATLANGAPGT